MPRANSLWMDSKSVSKQKNRKQEKCSIIVADAETCTGHQVILPKCESPIGVQASSDWSCIRLIQDFFPSPFLGDALAIHVVGLIIPMNRVFARRSKRKNTHDLQQEKEKKQCVDLKAKIPEWTRTTSLWSTDAGVESNGSAMDAHSLDVTPSGYKSRPRPRDEFWPWRSTRIDRSSNLQLWVDILSHDGILRHSKVHLCSAEFVYKNRDNFLAIGHGVHAKTFALKLSDKLAAFLNPEHTAFDLTQTSILTNLNETTTLPPPVQRIVRDYLVPSHVLVGLVHYPKTGYVNVIGLGTTLEETVRVAPHIPNVFLHVELAHLQPINQLPSKLLVEDEFGERIGCIFGESEIVNQ